MYNSKTENVPRILIGQVYSTSGKAQNSIRNKSMETHSKTKG